VELLVVIGIIAVLISVLLPTLNKARQAANRAACLANLRSVMQMMAIYAAENKQQIPMGTSSDVYQTSYFIAQGNSVTNWRWPTWGPLYKANLVKSPKYLYCPSETRSYHMFEGEDNRWKPDNPAGNLNDGLRAGFYLRPCSATYQPVLWRSTSPFTPVDNKNYPAASPFVWAPYPRISKMKRTAIAADIFGFPVRINQRHQKGFNVAYADGSATWCEREALKNDLPKSVNLYGNPANATAIAANAFEAMGLNDATSATNNPLMQAIWEMLDTRGK
jgi:prepilin-type processing-associated H-X9-DG protein